MAQVDRKPGEGQSFWTDGWDGYPKARERLLRAIAGSRVANPMVIGGDIHMYVVADLKTNFNDPRRRSLRRSSSAPPSPPREPGRSSSKTGAPKIRTSTSPTVSRRGYTTIDMTARRCTARMRAVTDVLSPAAGISTLAAWTVEDGKPGAQRGA